VPRSADLVAALCNIIALEWRNCASVEMQIPGPDLAIDPGDRSDRLATTKAALDAAYAHTPAQWHYRTGYSSAALPENLTPQQRDMSAQSLPSSSPTRWRSIAAPRGAATVAPKRAGAMSALRRAPMPSRSNASMRRRVVCPCARL
jgi:hypothetical protein